MDFEERIIRIALSTSIQPKLDHKRQNHKLESILTRAGSCRSALARMTAADNAKRPRECDLQIQYKDPTTPRKEKRRRMGAGSVIDKDGDLLVLGVVDSCVLGWSRAVPLFKTPSETKRRLAVAWGVWFHVDEPSAFLYRDPHHVRKSHRYKFDQPSIAASSVNSN